MRVAPRSLPALAALALLAACAGDPAAPEAPAAAARRPALLLANDESWRVVSESYDAAGNQVLVNELAAGVFNPAPGPYTSVASVTIRTVIPRLVPGASSAPCITSTIQKVETRPGWTYAVRKSGGCDKEIAVQLDNKAAGQRAQFSFLMIYGKTKVDHGLIR